MKPLIIAKEAEHELAASVAFYEKRQSGLGLDFERIPQEVLKKIASPPELWPVGKYGTQALFHAALSIRRSLSRYAGQNLDCRVCAHEPKTKVLENENSFDGIGCLPENKICKTEDFHTAVTTEISSGKFNYSRIGALVLR